MAAGLMSLPILPAANQVVSRIPPAEVSGGSSRYGQNLLDVEEKTDSGWRLGVVGIALSGDAFTNGNGDIAAVGLLGDVNRSALMGIGYCNLRMMGSQSGAFV
jgi:hypothetical protein